MSVFLTDGLAGQGHILCVCDFSVCSFWLSFPFLPLLCACFMCVFLGLLCAYLIEFPKMLKTSDAEIPHFRYLVLRVCSSIFSAYLLLLCFLWDCRYPSFLSFSILGSPPTDCFLVFSPLFFSSLGLGPSDRNVLLFSRLSRIGRVKPLITGVQRRAFLARWAFPQR